jgi:hypothetical protein
MGNRFIVSTLSSVAWAKTSKPNTHYQEWDEADQFPNGHVQPSWAKLPSTAQMVHRIGLKRRLIEFAGRTFR